MLKKLIGQQQALNGRVEDARLVVDGDYGVQEEVSPGGKVRDGWCLVD